MTRVLRSCAPILALLLLAASSCSAPPETRTGDAAAAEPVREEFLHAWRGYVEHAWGHDGLRPLSGEGFAPPETLDLDEVVFNTEAHPIRPPGARAASV